MALDDQIGAALDAAVSAAATAIVLRVQQLIALAIGLIGGALNVIDALTAPFVGQLDVVTTIRGALSDIADMAGAELEEVTRDGVLITIASVAAVADFPLDRDAPFSAESLTFAINHRLGTAIEDVTDRDSVERYLKNVAADKVNEAFGEVVFEDGDALDDPDAVKAFVFKRGAQLVNETFGIEAFTDLTDQEQWAALMAGQLIASAQQEAAFLGPHGCTALNAVLAVFAQTQVCHGCMDDYEGCLRKRENQRNHRDKHPRDCKWT